MERPMPTSMMTAGVVDWPMDHIIICEWSPDKLLSRFIRGHESTTWDIVWASAQQHRSYESVRLCNLFLQAPQWPRQCGNNSAATTVVAGGQNQPLTEFDDSVVRQQDVAGLDVTVNTTQTVQILKTVKSFGADDSNLILVKRLLVN